MKLKLTNEIKFFYDALMMYSSFFGSFVFLIVAVALLTIFNQGLFALRFIVAAFISMAIEYFVKLCYQEKRPDFKTIKLYSLFQSFQESGSFPSGHSSNIALFTTMVYLKYAMPYLTALFVAITILVGLSRIYLKRHYFKDVAAGYLLGIIIGFLVS